VRDARGTEQASSIIDSPAEAGWDKYKLISEPGYSNSESIKCVDAGHPPSFSPGEASDAARALESTIILLTRGARECSSRTARRPRDAVRSYATVLDVQDSTAPAHSYGAILVSCGTGRFPCVQCRSLAPTDPPYELHSRDGSRSACPLPLPLRMTSGGRPRTNLASPVRRSRKTQYSRSSPRRARHCWQRVAAVVEVRRSPSPAPREAVGDGRIHPDIPRDCNSIDEQARVCEGRAVHPARQAPPKPQSPQTTAWALARPLHSV
jgi:hypothetical protein